jgi:hypothetical protein
MEPVNINISADDSTRSLITCPITYQIFANPVVCTDGIVYEEQAIKSWLETNDTSPWTKEVLDSKRLVPIRSLRQFADNYVKLYPKEGADRYEPQMEIRVMRELVAKKVANLLKFGPKDVKRFFKLIMPIISNVLVRKIFKNEAVTCHIINTLDEPDVFDSNGISLAHYLCAYSSLKMIKLAIVKGIDLEVADTANWYPIHYASYRNSHNIIEYLMPICNLNVINDDGWSPAHFVFSNPKLYSTGTVDLFAETEGINFDAENDQHHTPLDVFMGTWYETTYQNMLKSHPALKELFKNKPYEDIYIDNVSKPDHFID